MNFMKRLRTIARARVNSKPQASLPLIKHKLLVSAFARELNILLDRITSSCLALAEEESLSESLLEHEFKVIC